VTSAAALHTVGFGSPVILSKAKNPALASATVAGLRD